MHSRPGLAAATSGLKTTSGSMLLDPRHRAPGSGNDDAESCSRFLDARGTASSAGPLAAPLPTGEAPRLASDELAIAEGGGHDSTRHHSPSVPAA